MKIRDHTTSDLLINLIILLINDDGDVHHFYSGGKKISKHKDPNPRYDIQSF